MLTSAPEADEATARLARLQRRSERERRARVDAEQLLEAKSHELYEANLALSQWAHDLERRVAERTQELTQARHEAIRQAQTDSLTGIANRAAFVQQLQTLLGDRTATMHGVAVLLIDLDDFKTVNDTLGHAAGDAVLVEVARRLLKTCRQGDLVGRLGGDEFAVLASGGSGETLQHAAHRMCEELSRPVPFHGRSVPTGCSIGVAQAAPDGASISNLLGDADLALYVSKRGGRGRVTLYEPRLRADLEQRAVHETAVRQAVLQAQIEPWYQPIRHCASGRFTGVEVLARWHHPDGRVYAPQDFLDTVESLGMLDLMMENMLHKALREAVPCIAAGSLKFLAINVSPAQFTQGWLLTRLPELMAETSFPPQALMVEITESALLPDMDRARTTLSALTKLRIRVAIDDFGVGFSNLSILRQLRFQKLKLDRSLVCDIETDERASAIAQCILELTHRLKINTVAEGVETDGQARLLEAAGCTFMQGYLFARPDRRLECWFKSARDEPAIGFR